MDPMRRQRAGSTRRSPSEINGDERSTDLSWTAGPCGGNRRRVTPRGRGDCLSARVLSTNGVEVTVKVIVYADALNRPAEVLHIDDALVELPDAPLEALLDAASAFPQHVGVMDWFETRVEASRQSAGGDGQGITVVVEFLQDLRDMAHSTLIGVFSAWLYDQLKHQDRDDGE